MAHKLCMVCNKRRAVEYDQCQPCSDYGMAENTHNDDDHEDIHQLTIEQTTFMSNNDVAGFNAYVKTVMDEMVNCPVCLGQDPANDTPRTGHTNTVAKSHTSHAGHAHARNPKDRAACRKSMAAGNGPLDLSK